MVYPQMDVYDSVSNTWERCDILGQGVNGDVVPLEWLTGQAPLPLPPGQAQYETLFDDGTFGFFDVHSGCTIGSAYAFGGSGNGCRMTPDPTTGITSLSSNSSFPGGQSWASLSFEFQLVTQPSLSDTYMNLFEIGNALTTAPKSQFTCYFNGGNLYMDFNAPEKILLGAAPTDGGWHRIETRCFFGDTTYTGFGRIDGGTTVNLVSGSTKTPTTAEVLWIHYPSTAVDYTMNIDNILLTTANSDPGWLTV